MKFLQNLHQTICQFVLALIRDLYGIITLIKVESKLKSIEKNGIVMTDMFRKLVRENPNKPCVVFYNQIWTFQDVLHFI